MPISKSTKKTLKRVALLTVIVLLLLLVALQIIGYRLNPIVSRLIKTNVTKATDSLYTIDFSSLNITIADQHVRIRNLHVYPNMDVFKKMQQNGTDPAMLYDVTIPSVSVGWLNIFRTYFDKELIIRSIEIVNPKIAITQESKKPGRVNTKTQFDPYQLISNTFSLAEIKKIEIKNGAVNFTQNFIQPVSFSLDSFNLQLNGIKIDSTTKRDTANFLKANYVDLSFRNLAYQTPDSLYNISMERFGYASNNQLSVKNLLLEENKQVFSSLKDRQQAPANLYHMYIPGITIDSVNLDKLFFKNAIKLGNVKIADPQIIITRNAQKATQHLIGPPQPKGDLAEIVNRVFKSVSSSKISISNAVIDFGSTRGTGSFLKLRNCSLDMLNVAIDSASNLDTSRFLASKDIQLNVKQLSYFTNDSLYRIKIVGIRGSLKNSSANIDSFQLIPRYNRFDFMKKAGHSATRAQITIPSISIKKFDYRQLINDQSLAIGSVNVDYMDLQAFCDQRFPDNNTVAPTIHGLINSINFPEHIDSIYIKKMNIVYEEFNARGKEPGRTTFDNLTVKVTNITNDIDQLKKNSLLTAEMNGLLFNAGKMDVKLVFYLNDKLGKFTINGTVAPMSATAFNGMVMPVTGAKVLSGDIKSASVSITANDNKAVGIVNVLYDNLKLDFSNASENKRTVSLKEKAIGFFATDAAESSNPSNGKQARLGQIDYTRSDTQFIINYAWKSIFEGLKAIIFDKAVSMQKTIKQVKKNLKELGGKKDKAK